MNCSFYRRLKKGGVLMYGACGIQHSREAYGYQGLAQDWQPIIKIVRTIQQIFIDRNGFGQSIRHNQETITIRKQIQFMGRK